MKTLYESNGFRIVEVQDDYYDMKTLLVKVRTVYGEQKVYPINELAQTFAALTGHKTLTPAAIVLIKQLGYEIQIQHEEIEL